jgi:hypothetical protein
MKASAFFNIMADIAREWQKQDKKWGEQHLPDGTDPDFFRPLADAVRVKTDLATQNGMLMWVDILYEEFYEACAESSWPELRKELIQVAAVCVAWVEDGDQRSDDLQRAKEMMGRRD